MVDVPQLGVCQLRVHSVTRLTPQRFTRANAGVFVVVDFAPFLARIAPTSAYPMEKLDLGVAALVREKVFMVRRPRPAPCP